MKVVVEHDLYLISYLQNSSLLNLNQVLTGFSSAKVVVEETADNPNLKP